MLQLFPALADIIRHERVTSYQDGYRDGLRARTALEDDHITTHPDIPINFIAALQHGTGTPTTVTIDGLHVTIATSTHGTGIPEPDSKIAWDHLVETVHHITAAPYCADVIASLPQELAAITWTGDNGAVNVTPSRNGPTRLRSILGIALVPLARAGDLLTASTVSASAAAVFAGGALTPTALPGHVEPLPDLQPKARISGGCHPGRKPHTPAAAKPRPRTKATAPPRAPRVLAVPSPRTRSETGPQTLAKRPSPAVKGAGVEVRPTSTAAVRSTPEAPAGDHRHKQGEHQPSGLLQLRQTLGIGTAHYKGR